jgi:formylglycine-generating enzyme required for sulfatase activity
MRVRTPAALVKFIARAAMNAAGFGIVGDFAIDVLPNMARDVWAWWGKDRSEAERRADLESLAQMPAGEIRREAEAAVAEVAAAQPPAVKAALTTYLTQLPESVRQSLRRPSDPDGRTAPPGLALKDAKDLLLYMPTALPRFKPGDRPLAGVVWVLTELLGIGGFGEVWKAHNRHAPPRAPPVALKFCLDPLAKDRLLRHEAAILNHLMRRGKHPGIVQLLHTYLRTDPPCLEYEYVEGGNLASWMRERRGSQGGLPPEHVIALMRQLAGIVGYAHQLEPPVVHRDLKPANILVQLTPNGEISLKVADFGIGGIVSGRALQESRSSALGGLSLTSAVRGAWTPLYSSPQQMGGDPPDPRDDVYSLGVIWYQLLTGNVAAGAPLAPGDLLWAKPHLKRGMTVAQACLLASCLEAFAERRPANADVLLQKMNQLDRAARPVAPSASAPPPSPGPEKRIRNSIGMSLVLILPGRFRMGSPKQDNEYQHEVEISQAFYMSRYPVTKGAFAAFVQETGHANPWAGPSDHHPVVNVDWTDAVAFCRWLTEKERKEYRLPTEAEWEYCCRAGTTTAFSFGDDPSELSWYGWYAGNSGGVTHKAGEKKPNDWGLYDMHGNVWEWCRDWYDKDYYRTGPRKDPQGPLAGLCRVIRGGSISNPPRRCRAARRFGTAPSFHYHSLGFRVVRVL